MLDKKRQTIEDTFFRYMSQEGALLKPSLSLIPPQTDDSLYFTNATIVNFKEDFLKGTPEHLATKQKCLRLHNVSRILDDDFKVEWLSLFNMVGTIIPPNQLKQSKSNIIELFTDKYGIEKTNLVFLVNSRDVNLYKDIPQGMLIFDSHPQKYYDWTFGVKDVYGAGLTFGFKQKDGSIIDVGNLIEIKKGDEILGYECAYGLECFNWAKEGTESILDSYPVFDNIDKSDGNMVKFVDAAMAVSAVESVCIEPNNKTPRGQILKKLYKNLFYLSENANLHETDVRSIFDQISKTEFDDTLDVGLIMDHYLESKTFINCQRNAFLTRKKSLVEAFSRGEITKDFLVKKMESWAEGKYYISKHERDKYFSLDDYDKDKLLLFSRQNTR